MTKICIQDKCKKCDIGYIIKDYLRPLMQAMTVHLKEYNMRLIETKCLNTSVLFYNLFFGKDALKQTMYCDVHNVVERHRTGQDNSTHTAKRLYDDVLRLTKHRYVYYIMLTDGYFNKPDGTRVFFPGHVFVFEKIPWGKSAVYHMYQSYIHEYDFPLYVAKNKNTIRISIEKAEYFMRKINDMVNNRVWDAEFAQFWKDMTKTDSEKFLGSSPDNAFFVCYRKLRINSCMKNVLKFAKSTYKKIPRGYDEMIYGDSRIYDIDSSPLTNGEMRTQFSKLIYRLQNDKNIIQDREILHKPTQ